MIYKTETGSVYQVDEPGKRVRRLSGTAAPTPRQGQDGEWKTYASVEVLNTSIGRQLWVDWTGAGNGTLTSPIVEETEEN